MKIAMAALLLLAGLAGCKEQTAGWQSPDKFYELRVPANWKQSRDDSPYGASFGFNSPDGSKEIRVSATYNLSLPKELPENMINMAFRDAKPVKPVEKIEGRKWDGLYREYVDTQGMRRWAAVLARNGSTLVFLTMSAPEAEFEKFRPMFRRVRESLTLGQ